MHNNWKRLYISLLILLIAGGIAFTMILNTFHEPGIHTFGKMIHADLIQDCYFFSGNTVARKSTFSISGYTLSPDWSTNTGSFSGVASVAQYPLSTNPHSLNGFSAGIEDDLIVITNQSYSILDENWDTYYTIHILKTNGQYIIVIRIYSKDQESMIAVCGESEEDAMRNYQVYLEAFGTLIE